MLREVVEPYHPLLILVPLQNLLVVAFGEHKCNYVCVCHYSRTSYSGVVVIRNSRLTYDCISAKDSDCPMVIFERWIPLFVEHVDTAGTLINDVHAVANIALVHQGLTFFKLFALQLVNQCSYQIIFAFGEEGYSDFKKDSQV